MKKRKIKSSVNDIINKVIREIRKELMASTKEAEPSNADDTIAEHITEPMIKDEIVNTPKKRGRRKKVAEPTKESDSLSVEDGIDYSKIKEPKNLKLTRARKAKNDEFYTRLCDVENELWHYKEHFKDKIVLCNCDDPTWSAFWKYFHINFSVLGLKKLIGTHYEKEKPNSYAVVYEGGNDDNTNDAKEINLEGNGDFRSDECIEYLKGCDIIVTNPPLSLFKEFVGIVTAYSKKFVVLGNNNVVTYKSFFPLLVGNKIWAGFGFNKVMDFVMPDKYELTGNGYIDENGKKHGFVPSMSWFTNLEIKKRYEDLILYKTYDDNKIDYPKYDNYDAINVDRVKDIPIDYNGVIGVPITFIDKYNPNQFEIVGCTESECRGASNGIWDEDSGICQALVNGKKKYKRLFIRRRHS